MWAWDRSQGQTLRTDSTKMIFDGSGERAVKKRTAGVIPAVLVGELHRREIYLPSMIQSPCDVPMNNNIGSDSQALVRDAMNA
jgi:hypothetical protein